MNEFLSSVEFEFSVWVPEQYGDVRECFERAGRAGE